METHYEKGIGVFWSARRPTDIGEGLQFEIEK